MKNKKGNGKKINATLMLLNNYVKGVLPGVFYPMDGIHRRRWEVVERKEKRDVKSSQNLGKGRFYQHDP